MKFSKKSEYAIYALIDLSRQEKEKAVPLSEISARQNIPMPFLEQIMLTLKSGGIVSSRRGSGGGFILSRHPKQITLGEIIKLTEGPLGLDTDSAKEYSSAERQVFFEIWQQVSTTVQKAIGRITLTDMNQRIIEINESREYSYVI
ncbi:MAG: Rrf2 family transcriptional regulator [candidate division KSB1 bacterium]|nr:Rrf2 family transcriptional regulator [candidate division KSB1 bacterium]